MRKTYILLTAFVAVILLIFTVPIQKTEDISMKILAQNDDTALQFESGIKYEAPAFSPQATITEHKDVQTADRERAQNIQNDAPASSVSPYPYTLSIPKINLQAPVLITGLEADGKMAVPNNYTEIGLFNGAAMPGEQGTAVMGAHVDNGGGTPGVFKHLRDLKAGDTVVVKTRDNSVLTYKVTALKIYNKDEKETNDVFYSNNGSHLNLITCYGTWLPKENTYKERLVVFTELMN